MTFRFARLIQIHYTSDEQYESKRVIRQESKEKEVQEKHNYLSHRSMKLHIFEVRRDLTHTCKQIITYLYLFWSNDWVAPLEGSIPLSHQFLHYLLFYNVYL